MSTAFHFGDSARPLYGVFHAAKLRAGGPAVLLCNPFGEEAIRAFRIYRLLAEKLAAEGAPTLRFDYYATGDSSGDCSEASLSGFVEGIREAHQELLDMSGAARSIWIGLRLGGAAAVLAARQSPQGLAGLILWDPIVTGAAYLDELAAGHRAAIESQIGRPPSDALSEAIGFELTDEFRRELAALNLLLGERTARKVIVIAGGDPATDPALRTALTDAGADVDWRADLDEASWNSDKALNSFVVPTRTLELIVETVRLWR